MWFELLNQEIGRGKEEVSWPNKVTFSSTQALRDYLFDFKMHSCNFHSISVVTVKVFIQMWKSEEKPLPFTEWASYLDRFHILQGPGGLKVRKADTLVILAACLVLAITRISI